MNIWRHGAPDDTSSAVRKNTISLIFVLFVSSYRFLIRLIASVHVIIIIIYISVCWGQAVARFKLILEKGRFRHGGNIWEFVDEGLTGTLGISGLLQTGVKMQLMYTV